MWIGLWSPDAPAKRASVVLEIGFFVNLNESPIPKDLSSLSHYVGLLQCSYM